MELEAVPDRGDRGGAQEDCPGAFEPPGGAALHVGGVPASRRRDYELSEVMFMATLTMRTRQYEQRQRRRRAPGAAPHQRANRTGARSLSVPSPARGSARRARGRFHQWQPPLPQRRPGTCESESVSCALSCERMVHGSAVGRRSHPWGRDRDHVHFAHSLHASSWASSIRVPVKACRVIRDSNWARRSRSALAALY